MSKKALADRVVAAEQAGKLAEEIQRLNNVIESMKDCRHIDIRWEDANGNSNNGKQFFIGKPGIKWPNSEVYDDMHEAITDVLMQRLNACHDALRKLMSGKE